MNNSYYYQPTNFMIYGAFHKTWSENLVLPPKWFTKQQDEPAAS